MKKIFFLAPFFMLACGTEQEAQFDAEAKATATSTFKVWGNCDMCKKTIESSLMVKGVRHASWNGETDLMEVQYDSSLISLDQLQQNVAAVGYDNDQYKGNDEAYSQLPDCCKYERKK